MSHFNQGSRNHLLHTLSTCPRHFNFMSPLRTGRALRSRFTLARWVARKSPIRTLVCTLGRRRRGSSRRGPRRRVRSRTAVTFQSSTLADGVADTDITLWQHSMVVAHGIILVLALPVRMFSPWSWKWYWERQEGLSSA